MAWSKDSVRGKEVRLGSEQVSRSQFRYGTRFWYDPRNVSSKLSSIWVATVEKRGILDEAGLLGTKESEGAGTIIS